MSTVSVIVTILRPIDLSHKEDAVNEAWDEFGGDDELCHSERKCTGYFLSLADGGCFCPFLSNLTLTILLASMSTTMNR